MTTKDTNEFTDREKLLLSYYRVPEDTISRRTWLWDGVIGIGSLVCLFLSVVREDMALGFVAYTLIVGRWCYTLLEGGRWNKDFRSIFAKYDAKLRALETQQGKQAPDGAA